MSTYDTVTLPADPSSSDERDRLLSQGYTETRVKGALVFQRRADRGSASAGSTSDVSDPDVSDANSPNVSSPDVSSPSVSSSGELVDRVGARVAGKLAEAGLDTLDAAQARLADDPDGFAALPGIGPATIAKLDAS